VAFFSRHQKIGPPKPTANPYPSRFQKWRSSLGITFFSILVMGAALRFYKPFYHGIQQGLFETTATTQGVLNSPFQALHHFFNDIVLSLSLRQDYALLQAENEVLKEQLQVLKPLQHENEVLKKSLKVTAFERHGHLTARVLSNPYDGMHHFFLIAAGKKEGLEKDQAVIVPTGVVGRLETVGTYVARVLLLNDARSRIPVMTENSAQKAILAGDGSHMPTLVYVGDVRKIRRGEKVVTSGLGGIFPAGLSVGVVDDITNGKISVRLYVAFHTLEWVHLLKPYTAEFLEEFTTGLENE